MTPGLMVAIVNKPFCEYLDHLWKQEMFISAYIHIGILLKKPVSRPANYIGQG
jgi:hypothetical protein